MPGYDHAPAPSSRTDAEVDSRATATASAQIETEQPRARGADCRIVAPAATRSVLLLRLVVGPEQKSERRRGRPLTCLVVRGSRCLARHGGAYGTGIEKTSAARFRARILSSRSVSLRLPCLGCTPTLPRRGLCDRESDRAGRAEPLACAPGRRAGCCRNTAPMGFRLRHAHFRDAYEMAWLLSCSRAWSVSAWAAGLVGRCWERHTSLRRARSSGRVIFTAWTSGA